jgi:hypothetical protein
MRARRIAPRVAAGADLRVRATSEAIREGNDPLYLLSSLHPRSLGDPTTQPELKQSMRLRTRPTVASTDVVFDLRPIWRGGLM